MAGLSTAVNAVVLLWQALQSPLPGCAGSATAYMPAALVGRVWNPVYGAVMAAGYGEGEVVTPTHWLLNSWQLAHPLVTPVCTIDEVGTGVAKPVPGARCAALAASSADGTLPAWQLTQVAVDGMCEVDPGSADAGMVTILLMP